MPKNLTLFYWFACGIIEDTVKKEVDFREQIKVSAESCSFRSSQRQRQNNDKQHLFLTSEWLNLVTI